ncbi:hypothetical protein TNCV_1489931 [Trichonephila clavipes]|nr:hypothetical protein TNCV_1489931 [Trichonephila clavipes]
MRVVTSISESPETPDFWGYWKVQSSSYDERHSQKTQFLSIDIILTYITLCSNTIPIATDLAVWNRAQVARMKSELAPALPKLQRYAFESRQIYVHQLRYTTNLQWHWVLTTSSQL